MERVVRERKETSSQCRVSFLSLTGARNRRLLMPRHPAITPLHAVPLLAHETLYVGIDIGKLEHVAGFVSRTLLSRYQRFESCPALTFEQSREGFRALLDRIEELVPLTQVYTLLEVTGHYHKALLQYLHECEIPVYLLHVQKR